jgi:methylated-DNA-protein-cysteine methyltransferase-like protein
VASAPREGREERDERILDVIRSLREGEVVTYGDIAADAGFPKLSRLVGRLLASGAEYAGTEHDAELPEPDELGGGDPGRDELPWWRVVNAAGRLVPGNEREQATLLRSEGVTVSDGRVRTAPLGRFSRRPRP